MAQSSNRAKHIRKLKRKASLATRILKSRTVEYFNVVTALLSVLAQQGGEVTITQGTANQAVQEFVKGQLSWAMVPGKVEGEFVVRLVTREVEKPAEISPVTLENGSTIEFTGSAEEKYVGIDTPYTHLTEESDALLDQEGVPDFEIGQQIGRDDVD